MTTPIFDPGLYPRAYVPSIGLRLFAAVAGTGLVAAGLAMPWISPHAWNRTADIVLDCALLPLGVALGLACIIAAVRSRVTLGADAIEVRGLTTRRATRDRIVDFRVVPLQHGLIAYQLRVKDSRWRLKFTPLFKRDAAFEQWFAGLRDLDRAEADARLRAIERDDRLGATPEARREYATRAGRLAASLTWLAMAVALWAMIRPQPYLLALSVAAALPLLGIALCWRWRDLVTLSSNRPTAGGDLGAVIIAPAAIVALRGVMDVELAQPMQVIAPAAGLAAVLLLLLIAANAGLRRSPLAILGFAVVTAAYATGVLRLADTRLDHAAASLTATTIAGLRHTTGKGATAYARLAGHGSRPDEFQVSFDFLHRHAVGDRVCLLDHPGALGWRWWEVADAAACDAP